jgi:hypothetical protein
MQVGAEHRGSCRFCHHPVHRGPRAQTPHQPKVPNRASRSAIVRKFHLKCRRAGLP